VYYKKKRVEVHIKRRIMNPSFIIQRRRSSCSAMPATISPALSRRDVEVPFLKKKKHHRNTSQEREDIAYNLKT